MRHIILGQSVTAVKFIEQLRARGLDDQVTCVAFDEHLPAVPERFADLISRKIARKDVFYRGEKFYHDLNVEFIWDKKVSRINFNRKTVFFDDKTRLEGDMILIADTGKTQFPDIKGTGREGVFSLRRFQDVACLLAMINRIDTIFVESQTLTGILLAQALASQDKEVIFCLPSDSVMPHMLNDEMSNVMMTLIESCGIRVIRRGRVQEVLGENDVKAVRLNIGKVIAAEMVIFPDALPDFRMYSSAGLEVQDRIHTDQRLRTNIDGIFAVGDMVQGFLPEMNYCDPEALREDQAARLTAAVTHQENTVFPERPARIFHFEIAGHALAMFGNPAVPDAHIYRKISQDGLLEKYLVVKDGMMQGAVLMDHKTEGRNFRDACQPGQIIDPQNHALFSDCVRLPEVTAGAQAQEDGGLESEAEPSHL